jgi:quinoprotein glucose dehydrogenase
MPRLNPIPLGRTRWLGGLLMASGLQLGAASAPDPAPRASAGGAQAVAEAAVVGRLQVASGWRATSRAVPPPVADPQRMENGERNGVRVTDVRGHPTAIDSTAPVIGPDDFVYFFVGHDAGTEPNPESCEIWRSRRDGSQREQVAVGLRRPRGWAWDDSGNLFTTDAEAGWGDAARLVQVVEGGDSGWREAFARLPDPLAGPWMREGRWNRADARLPAYVLPPVGLLDTAPAGLAFDPDAARTADPIGALVVAHLGRTPDESLVRSYCLESDGAGFSVRPGRRLVAGLLPAGVAFADDGSLLVADLVRRSAGPDTAPGRMLALTRETAGTSLPKPTSPLRYSPGADLTLADAEELTARLAASDRRVRLAAQFEWARRGAPSVPHLEALVMRADAVPLARRHALWALGQLAGTVPAALNRVPALLEDSDAELRAQAAKVLGDTVRIEAYRFLRTALRDPAPRVVFFAAQSLGKLRRPDAIPALIETLRRNDDRDPLVRHALVVALARLGPDPALLATLTDPARAVRLGGLLAYRRLRDPGVARFLEDADTGVVREAVIAVHDLGLETAWPALAAQLESAPWDDEAVVRRALQAHALLGQPDHARALAAFAAKINAPAVYRAEALDHLASWGRPSDRDRVSGRPLPPIRRDPAPAREIFVDFLTRMPARTPPEVQIATLRAVAGLGVTGAGHALWDVVYQEARPVDTRVAALQALETLDDLRLEVAAQHAARSPRVELRLASIPVLARRHPAVSLPLLEPMTRTGTPEEQRRVYLVLAGMTDARADEVLGPALRRLAEGGVPAAAEAELLFAAEQRTEAGVVAALRELQTTRRADADRLAQHRGVLAGGDPEAGRAIFERPASSSCIQCHTTRSGLTGGGPPHRLAGSVAGWTRERVLTALIDAGAPGACAQTGVPAALSRFELRDLLAYVAGLEEDR